MDTRNGQRELLTKMEQFRIFVTSFCKRGTLLYKKTVFPYSYVFRSFVNTILLDFNVSEVYAQKKLKLNQALRLKAEAEICFFSARQKETKS